MIHDIIDNSRNKLSEEIRNILPSCESAKFAVGFFFLSGFTAIADQLDNVKELQLLVGSASSSETVEQIAEGYLRLNEVQQELDKVNHPKKTDSADQLTKTTFRIGQNASALSQSDENQRLILSLSKAIEEQRVKVKLYSKGRLHAKAYIFDYGQRYDAQGRALPRPENGCAIVGSSNLTLAGLTHNSELNVKVFGDANHAALTNWFNNLWDDAIDFDQQLVSELKQSWAIAKVPPYHVYLKALYEFVKDRLADEGATEYLWQSEITAALADFQRNAVQRAIQIIRQYNGAFVSDVVGLGKSYIGAAIIKHFERYEHTRSLIICPQSLVRMWEHYNEAYKLNARVLSMGMLKDDPERSEFNLLLESELYSDRDFVLVDESHNFRNRDTQRYKILQEYLQASGRRCVFLTATPRNRSIWDIYNQLILFHDGDRTQIPINPPNLRDFIKGVEKGEHKAASLLSNIMVRRTRMDVLRWYGFDAETHKRIDPFDFEPYHSGDKRAYIIVNGKEQYFPKRELSTIEYNIDDTYDGLYDKLLGMIGRPGSNDQQDDHRLLYARYGLWNYVKEEKQKTKPYDELQRAGINLRGLMRVSLFKRFESSVEAFRRTLQRIISGHEAFLLAMSNHIIPAGKAASARMLTSSDIDDDELLDILEEMSQDYEAEDFYLDQLRDDIKHDLDILKEMLSLVTPITPENDDKLLKLKEILTNSGAHGKPLADKKCLIFTQYKDTAEYLYKNLRSDLGESLESIFGTDKDKSYTAFRFSPKANANMSFSGSFHEIQTLVATDVMSEGLNLQDCDQIINYDLHWNPVRLIQRFGRIDRIGTKHDVIYGYNFLPEKELDRGLGLLQKLGKRIEEINLMLGGDSAILDPAEKLIDQAFLAIYQGQNVDRFDTEDDEDLVDLTEAEEFMRQLKLSDPELYKTIQDLRDGVRSCKAGKDGNLYTVCRYGSYRLIYSIDKHGNVTASDISEALGQMKCDPDEPALEFNDINNNRVVKIQDTFEKHVEEWKAQQRVAIKYPRVQQYILEELRDIDVEIDAPGWQGQVIEFMKTYDQQLPISVINELRGVYKKVHGVALLEYLEEVYRKHKLKEGKKVHTNTDQEVCPTVVCSLMVEVKDI
jgi:superfamily II DNA or RNA helicase/HKD family nuclease